MSDEMLRVDGGVSGWVRVAVCVWRSQRVLTGGGEGQVRALLESESKVREKEQELLQQKVELVRQEQRLQVAQAQLEQDRIARMAALESWARELRERELKQQAEAPRSPITT
jgi:hypothetical protein